MANPRRIVTPSQIEYLASEDGKPGWGVNWQVGCKVGCVYCWARALSERWGWCEPGAWSKPPQAFWTPDDLGLAIEVELRRRRNPVTGYVMVSSRHEPFDRGREEFGRTAVRTFSLYFKEATIMTLSKRPLAGYGVLRGLYWPHWFGASITIHEPGLSRYEPGAEETGKRLEALEKARAFTNTWASVEPVLPGSSLVQIVRVLLANGHRGWIVLGKLNLQAGMPEELREFAHTHDWQQDLRDAAAMLDAAGWGQSPYPQMGAYYVKGELARAAGWK